MSTAGIKAICMIFDDVDVLGAGARATDGATTTATTLGFEIGTVVTPPRVFDKPEFVATGLAPKPVIPKKFNVFSSEEGFFKTEVNALFDCITEGLAHKYFLCKAITISFLVTFVNPATGGLSEYRATP